MLIGFVEPVDSTLAVPADARGPTDRYGFERLRSFIKRYRVGHVVCRCDQEKALVAAIEKIFFIVRIPPNFIVSQKSCAVSAVERWPILPQFQQHSHEAAVWSREPQIQHGDIVSQRASALQLNAAESMLDKSLRNVTEDALETSDSSSSSNMPGRMATLKPRRPQERLSKEPGFQIHF